MLVLERLDLRHSMPHPDRWDELWQRSRSRVPSCRAAGVDLWCQSFAADADRFALVVRKDDRWVAGIPLIQRSVAGCWSRVQLPNNDTVSSGDLLIDSAIDSKAATSLIAEELSRLPFGLLSLNRIEINTPRWQTLVSQLSHRGNEIHVGSEHQVGVIDILHDWPAYTRSWSRNHRSALKRTRKKFEAEGRVDVERVRDASDERLGDLLTQCFEIEDRGWKGDQGTSILRTPGMADYFHAEARLMRDAGMLDLWLLKLDDRIVAFEYCHLAKSICFSHKISFDPAWEKYSPGRLLRYYQLERLHNDPGVGQLDTLGVLCQAKAKWTTRDYVCGRVLVATGGCWPNRFLRFAKTGRQFVRKLRSTDLPASIEPGAARYLQLTSPGFTERECELSLVSGPMVSELNTPTHA